MNLPVNETGFRTACRSMLVAVVLLAPMVVAAPAWAQRQVNFAPAEAKPPPRAKNPPRTQSSGEDVGIILEWGPGMRKTQQRTPPPPTNLTVMYKLKYGEELQYVHADGTVQKFEQWKSFPNDGHKLVSSTNERLADGMNYQYTDMPLSAGGFDPLDIPLLYMAGDYEFVLSDTEVENLRQFLLDGGTILFNAARGRDEFSSSVVREMRRVFADKTFMKMPLDHPVFNARYRIGQVMTLVNGVQFMRPPEVYSIDIGVRAAAILVPHGLGTAWSGTEYHPQGKHLVGESAVRLGVNLVAYVLGSTEYGRFLSQEFPVYSGQTQPGDVLRFAVARYSGSWDIYPGVQNSALQTIEQSTGIGVDYSPSPINLDDPQLGRYPLLFMTGHYDFVLTDEEITNVRQYLSRGGTIFASAGAGLSPFDVAFRREMKRVLTGADFVRLPPSHELFSRGWVPMDRITYTEAALRDDPLLEYPEFHGLFMDGRLAVLYTPFDLMAGINREPNPYSKGVVTDDAMKLLINIVTYLLSH